MADSMTIGPALAIGGNKVQMTQQIQVTNPQGKIITLSQDEFKKQLIENADKINNGEDFKFKEENSDFKKDNKNLKIAGAAVGVAAIVTGVIYRKEIGKYMKDFSFSKLWDDIKGLGKKAKDAAGNLVDNITGKSKKAKRNATYSVEEAANDAHRYHASNFEKNNWTTLQRDDAIVDATEAFKNYDPVKYMSKRKLEKAGLTEEQFSVMSNYARSGEGVKLTAEQKQILPNWAQDKETCQRYTTQLNNEFKKLAETLG